MIILSVIIRVPPAELAGLRPAIAEVIGASRAEPGNLAYTYGEDMIEPGVIRVFEVYIDEAALKAHADSAHFRAWRAVSGQYPREERRLYEAKLRPG
jgi:quinol monooxygenase YgiN